MSNAAGQVSALTEQFARYVASANARPLPPRVAAKTKEHLLDTLAAILSGSRLKAGTVAYGFVEAQGGRASASVIGSPLLAPPALAALANGMAGHADETDDSHLIGRCHPGCAIVPAALAVAQEQDRTGAELLAAVALGYDIAVRVNLALGLSRPDKSRFSTHSLGPAFGAAAAAAALYRLNTEQVRFCLAYACQQASGIPFWNRDSYHVEKAFDFGGMPARNGVLSASMVAHGFSAVDDPLAGPHSLFTAFAREDEAAPHLLIEGLGERYEIERASIKKWCVGSPIQAALDAVMALIEVHKVTTDDVQALRITLPDDRIHIVDNRAMPDVCVQHACAVALIDRGLSFASIHDAGRMLDPAVLTLRARMTLIPSPALTIARPARQAIVEIDTVGGAKLRHHAKAVRGTPDNPMTLAEIEAKAHDLMEPILGPERAQRLVNMVAKLDELAQVRDLRSVLSA